MNEIAPRRREALAVVELDGEAVVFDEVSYELHHLNPSAALVWSFCDGLATVEQLAADIAEAFDLPREPAEAQVRGIVATFASAGLLGSDGGGA